MSETRSFLDALFGAKEDSEYILIWLLDGRRSAWFQDIGAAADYVEQHAKKDVYVGVALSPADHGPSQRLKIEGGERLPSSIVALWADLDISDGVHKKTSLPPNEDAARSIMFPELPPSVLIHSGGGLQAWWLFREPWQLESADEVRKAGELAARWNRALRARAAAKQWDVDSVSDLTRVLRIPGGTNCKIPGQPRPVRLLEVNERRYNPSDLAEFLDLIGAEKAPVSTPPAASSITAGTRLAYDPSAQPDFDKFNLVCEAEPLFRRSFEHRRKDLIDQSASAYDMALANLAVQAGWADQEIANLLIAHRRKFNEDLKLRDSYYAKTIGKARAAFGSNDSVIAESAAGAPGAPLAKPETEKRPPAASSDRKPASEHLATIGRGFGLRVLRVTKYGGEQDGTFEIAVECQDGIERKVDLGRAIDVLNPRLTQGAIAGAIGAVIPNFKKGDSYLNLCRSIFAAAGPAPVELASDQQELLAWLRQFAAERYIPALNESEKRALGDRLNEGAFAGMWNERGELLLYLPFFLSVLFAVARVRPTWKDVTLRLRKLGFRPCDLEGVDSGGHRRRVNVWRSQPGLDRELGLVGDSGGSPTNPPIRRNISFSSTDIGDSGEVGKVALN